jgi:hypothetical protein
MELSLHFYYFGEDDIIVTITANEVILQDSLAELVLHRVEHYYVHSGVPCPNIENF